MRQIIKLLLHSGKFITCAATNTLIEIFSTGVKTHHLISMEYERATNVIGFRGSMFELINSNSSDLECLLGECDPSCKVAIVDDVTRDSLEKFLDLKNIPLVPLGSLKPNSNQAHLILTCKKPDETFTENTCSTGFLDDSISVSRDSKKYLRCSSNLQNSNSTGTTDTATSKACSEEEKRQLEILRQEIKESLDGFRNKIEEEKPEVEKLHNMVKDMLNNQSFLLRDLTSLIECLKEINSINKYIRLLKIKDNVIHILVLNDENEDKAPENNSASPGFDGSANFSEKKSNEKFSANTSNSNITKECRDKCLNDSKLDCYLKEQHIENVKTDVKKQFKLEEVGNTSASKNKHVEENETDKKINVQNSEVIMYSTNLNNNASLPKIYSDLDDFLKFQTKLAAAFENRQQAGLLLERNEHHFRCVEGRTRNERRPGFTKLKEKLIDECERIFTKTQYKLKITTFLNEIIKKQEQNVMMMNQKLCDRAEKQIIEEKLLEELDVYKNTADLMPYKNTDQNVMQMHKKSANAMRTIAAIERVHHYTTNSGLATQKLKLCIAPEHFAELANTIDRKLIQEFQEKLLKLQVGFKSKNENKLSETKGCFTNTEEKKQSHTKKDIPKIIEVNENVFNNFEATLNPVKIVKCDSTSKTVIENKIGIKVSKTNFGNREKRNMSTDNRVKHSEELTDTTSDTENALSADNITLRQFKLFHNIFQEFEKSKVKDLDTSNSSEYQKLLQDLLFLEPKVTPVVKSFKETEKKYPIINFSQIENDILNRNKFMEKQKVISDGKLRKPVNIIKRNVILAGKKAVSSVKPFKNDTPKIASAVNINPKQPLLSSIPFKLKNNLGSNHINDLNKGKTVSVGSKLMKIPDFKDIKKFPPSKTSDKRWTPKGTEHQLKSNTNKNTSKTAEMEGNSQRKIQPTVIKKHTQKQTLKTESTAKSYTKNIINTRHKPDLGNIKGANVNTLAYLWVSDSFKDEKKSDPIIKTERNKSDKPSSLNLQKIENEHETKMPEKDYSLKINCMDDTDLNQLELLFGKDGYYEKFLTDKIEKETVDNQLQKIKEDDEDFEGTIEEVEGTNYNIPPNFGFKKSTYNDRYRSNSDFMLQKFAPKTEKVNEPPLISNENKYSREPWGTNVINEVPSHVKSEIRVSPSTDSLPVIPPLTIWNSQPRSRIPTIPVVRKTSSQTLGIKKYRYQTKELVMGKKVTKVTYLMEE